MKRSLKKGRLTKQNIKLEKRESPDTLAFGFDIADPPMEWNALDNLGVVDPNAVFCATGDDISLGGYAVGMGNASESHSMLFLYSRNTFAMAGGTPFSAVAVPATGNCDAIGDVTVAVPGSLTSWVGPAINIGDAVGNDDYNAVEAGHIKTGGMPSIK